MMWRVVWPRLDGTHSCPQGHHPSICISSLLLIHPTKYYARVPICWLFGCRITCCPPARRKPESTPSVHQPFPHAHSRLSTELSVRLSTCCEVTLSTGDLNLIMIYKPYGAQNYLKPTESIQLSSYHFEEETIPITQPNGRTVGHRPNALLQ